jgi:hypothetical protein
MNLVTVVNRTSKPLEALWDGKRYALPVGKSAHPAIVAEAAKRQNPVMGSEDPYTLQMDYLIGVEEWGDPCDPIEQSPEIERMTRKKLVGAKPSEVVPGKTGIYSVRDVASSLPSDASGKFVTP